MSCSDNIDGLFFFYGRFLILLTDRQGLFTEVGQISLALPGHLDFAEMQCLSITNYGACLLYTSPSPRDKRQSRMPSSA